MSKYAPLANHLKAQLEDSVELAFTHIDSLVNGLPPSARNHDAWWANSRTEDSHTWAHLWIAAGWECDSVDRANEIAVFRRASHSLSKPAHRYWWVNHKQTHLDEYSGGYIWAPKTKKNGNSNEGYLNLTKAKVGDRIISYANGVIKSIGVVTNDHVDAPIPKTHWEAAEYWGSSGWQVSVEWMPLTTPLRPKNFLYRIAPLLPEKYSPIQKNGDGNQGIYLASISQDLGNLILSLVCEVDPTAVQTVNEIEIEGEDALQEQILRSSEIPETEKQQLVRSRIGQGIFRMRVAQQEKRCRLTGVDNLAFLVASHIKPWRYSDNEERLSGSNGLLLSPHVDKLFDRGWISFSDDGRVLISEQAKSVAQAWGLAGTPNVGAFDPIQRTFLKYHRENIFKGAGA
ncbi:HNH endonuclease [Pseudomonas sp. T1.Ur]|uniref:HNH endonuclease n=1 Tax=Pseudomonas sp. T1.Ur TaxID=2928704 RepID=UPI00201D78BF|nr:HNH endonuclease [Pseudomonas sp. T1.Ur]MCL6701290.1 HNH endonuclease [Pseudomonas sp. T1.Ur]